MKRILVLALAFLFSAVCMAAVTYTPAKLDEALKQVLGTPEKIEKAEAKLTAAQAAAINTAAGSKIFAEGADVAYTFYFGIKGGKKITVAAVESAKGKHDMVITAVGLDAATGAVKDVAIIAMKEQRGEPVKLRNFLGQFTGKGAADKIEVTKDIRAVSGATYSSRAVAVGVKKAVLAYKTLYLK